MPINITKTNDTTNQYLKVLVHAPSGAGKTRLCATTGDLERTVIISAESGLLSIRQHDIDVIQVNDMPTFIEAYEYLSGDRKYTWVCIDSITEIAEICLKQQLHLNTDGRMAYGNMNELITDYVKKFRDLPKNVYMSCKQEKLEDEGALIRTPAMPGKKLAQAMPYLFDEVFCIRKKEHEGKTYDYLQTCRDESHEAKDRSGALKNAEPCSLSKIYNKIMNQPNQ